jgi:very-short-patch-repair endonuclease
MSGMSHQEIKSFLRSAARSMRSGPIDVEKDLWWRLRGRKLGGFKFRRQHPIGGYIADFTCLEEKLVIELDGKQHQGSQSDATRTRAPNRLGFKVIRFDNERVRAYLDDVCEEILAAARSLRDTPHPAAAQPPSPTRGEG